MSTIFRPDYREKSDRSARDRVRHRQKIKDSIRKNIGDIIAEESIIGRDNSKVIKIPIRSIKEYRFIYGDNAPGVAGGTGNEKPGDVVQEGQDEQEGQGQGDKAGNKPGDDILETEITLEDLIDLMFEDLELPDLEKKSFKEIITNDSFRRNGKRKVGIRPRLDKRSSALNRVKRKLGHKRRNESLVETSLEEQIAEGAEEEKRFPFHKDDLRYFHIVPTPKYQSNAVIFCIMDTSGSMGNTKKYLARSFYFLLYQFVRNRYENVEVVFISHHTEAKEVTEEEFFHKVESGGTYISSGYNKALQIIEDRYHPSNWNIYAFHCSDGDNFYSDNDRALEAAEKLCDVCNLFGYGEIKPAGSSYYSGSMLEVYGAIERDNFKPVVIESKEDLWIRFKEFLQSDKEGYASAS